MITALLVALIYIGIICIVAGLIIKLVPLPPILPQIIWAVVGIVCLLLLLAVFTGGLPTPVFK